MEILHTPEAMRAWSQAARASGLRVGFVPTMGFLHAGHTALMDTLRPRVDRLVVSIYVNPLQFGPQEDLGRYPRDPEGDTAACRAHGVDALFMPETLYPPGFSTSVRVAGLTEGLCGASRPGHFEGVATVVARLIGLVGADELILGEKDFQQLMVVRRMVADLALPVRVVPGALVRDTDGLALSSRNVYLKAAERARALSLSRALRVIAAAAAAGETSADALLTLGRAEIDADRLDYLELVDAEDLRPIQQIERPARVLVAAFYGNTRLIDNLPVGPELRWT